MTTVEQDVMVRPASIADRPSVLALLESSLGWQADSRNADLFAWKHEQSPFGPSPAWVAVDREGRLLGFRTFLRWEFTRGSAVVRAGTRRRHGHPTGRAAARDLLAAHQDGNRRPGRRRRGVCLQHAEPAESPRLPQDGMAAGGPPAGSRTRDITHALDATRPCPPPGREVVADAPEPACPPVTPSRTPTPWRRLLAGLDHTDGLRTRISVEYLRWRYGFPTLRYRVATAGATVEDGVAVFRFRRRGTAVEAVICDLLVPGEDRRLDGELCRRVLEVTGADYAICLGRPRGRGFAPLPAKDRCSLGGRSGPRQGRHCTSGI